MKGKNIITILIFNDYINGKNFKVNFLFYNVNYYKFNNVKNYIINIVTIYNFNKINNKLNIYFNNI